MINILSITQLSRGLGKHEVLKVVWDSEEQLSLEFAEDLLKFIKATRKNGSKSKPITEKPSKSKGKKA